MARTTFTEPHVQRQGFDTILADEFDANAENVAPVSSSLSALMDLEKALMERASVYTKRSSAVDFGSSLLNALAIDMSSTSASAPSLQNSYFAAVFGNSLGTAGAPGHGERECESPWTARGSSASSDSGRRETPSQMEQPREEFDPWSFGAASPFPSDLESRTGPRDSYEFSPGHAPQDIESSSAWTGLTRSPTAAQQNRVPFSVEFVSQELDYEQSDARQSIALECERELEAYLSRGEASAMAKHEDSLQVKSLQLLRTSPNESLKSLHQQRWDLSVNRSTSADVHEFVPTHQQPQQQQHPQQEETQQHRRPHPYEDQQQRQQQLQAQLQQPHDELRLELTALSPRSPTPSHQNARSPVPGTGSASSSQQHSPNHEFIQQLQQKLLAGNDSATTTTRLAQGMLLAWQESLASMAILALTSSTMSAWRLHTQSSKSTRTVCGWRLRAHQNNTALAALLQWRYCVAVSITAQTHMTAGVAAEVYRFKMQVLHIWRLWAALVRRSTLLHESELGARRKQEKALRRAVVSTRVQLQETFATFTAWKRQVEEARREKDVEETKMKDSEVGMRKGRRLDYLLASLCRSSRASTMGIAWQLWLEALLTRRCESLEASLVEVSSRCDRLNGQLLEVSKQCLERAKQEAVLPPPTPLVRTSTTAVQTCADVDQGAEVREFRLHVLHNWRLYVAMARYTNLKECFLRQARKLAVEQSAAVLALHIANEGVGGDCFVGRTVGGEVADVRAVVAVSMRAWFVVTLRARCERLAASLADACDRLLQDAATRMGDRVIARRAANFVLTVAEGGRLLEREIILAWHARARTWQAKRASEHLKEVVNEYRRRWQQSSVSSVERSFASDKFALVGHAFRAWAWIARTAKQFRALSQTEMRRIESLERAANALRRRCNDLFTRQTFSEWCNYHETSRVQQREAWNPDVSEKAAKALARRCDDAVARQMYYAWCQHHGLFRKNQQRAYSLERASKALGRHCDDSWARQAFCAWRSHCELCKKGQQWNRIFDGAVGALERGCDEALIRVSFGVWFGQFAIYKATSHQRSIAVRAVDLLVDSVTLASTARLCQACLSSWAGVVRGERLSRRVELAKFSARRRVEWTISTRLAQHEIALLAEVIVSWQMAICESKLECYAWRLNELTSLAQLQRQDCVLTAAAVRLAAEAEVLLKNVFLSWRFWGCESRSASLVRAWERSASRAFVFVETSLTIHGRAQLLRACCRCWRDLALRTALVKSAREARLFVRAGIVERLLYLVVKVPMEKSWLCWRAALHEARQVSYCTRLTGAVQIAGRECAKSVLKKLLTLSVREIIREWRLATAASFEYKLSESCATALRNSARSSGAAQHVVDLLECMRIASMLRMQFDAWYKFSSKMSLLIARRGGERASMQTHDVAIALVSFNAWVRQAVASCNQRQLLDAHQIDRSRRCESMRRIVELCGNVAGLVEYLLSVVLFDWRIAVMCGRVDGVSRKIVEAFRYRVGKCTSRMVSIYTLFRINEMLVEWRHQSSISRAAGIEHKWRDVVHNMAEGFTRERHLVTCKFVDGSLRIHSSCLSLLVFNGWYATTESALALRNTSHAECFWRNTACAQSCFAAWHLEVELEKALRVCRHATYSAAERFHKVQNTFFPLLILQAWYMTSRLAIETRRVDLAADIAMQEASDSAQKYAAADRALRGAERELENVVKVCRSATCKVAEESCFLQRAGLLQLVLHVWHASTRLTLEAVRAENLVSQAANSVAHKYQLAHHALRHMADTLCLWRDSACVQVAFTAWQTESLLEKACRHTATAMRGRLRICGLSFAGLLLDKLELESTPVLLLVILGTWWRCVSAMRSCQVKQNEQALKAELEVIKGHLASVIARGSARCMTALQRGCSQAVATLALEVFLLWRAFVFEIQKICVDEHLSSSTRRWRDIAFSIGNQLAQLRHGDEAVRAMLLVISWKEWRLAVFVRKFEEQSTPLASVADVAYGATDWRQIAEVMQQLEEVLKAWRRWSAHEKYSRDMRQLAEERTKLAHELAVLRQGRDRFKRNTMHIIERSLTAASLARAMQPPVMQSSQRRFEEDEDEEGSDDWSPMSPFRSARLNLEGSPCSLPNGAINRSFGSPVPLPPLDELSLWPPSDAAFEVGSS